MEERSARRRFLALGAAGLGAIAASMAGPRQAAASSHLVGSSSDASVAGVRGEHANTGRGVEGVSQDGLGVYGFTSAGSYALQGHNAGTGDSFGVFGLGKNGVLGAAVHENGGTGIGVSGTSLNGIGVFASSGTGTGVRGETTSNFRAGVEGFNAATGPNSAGIRGIGSGVGMGVEGQCVNGIGVWGVSQTDVGVSASALSGVAMRAFAPAGLRAIQVGGKAGFSTVGAGTLAARASSIFVPQAHVTATSHITVALTSDPGSAAVVHWIERTPGSGFTVHLDRATRDATTFTYFIADTFA